MRYRKSSKPGFKGQKMLEMGAFGSLFYGFFEIWFKMANPGSYSISSRFGNFNAIKVVGKDSFKGGLNIKNP
jgi:hypothetical protein